MKANPYKSLKISLLLERGALLLNWTVLRLYYARGWLSSRDTRSSFEREKKLHLVAKLTQNVDMEFLFFIWRLSNTIEDMMNEYSDDDNEVGFT